MYIYTIKDNAAALVGQREFDQIITQDTFPARIEHPDTHAELRYSPEKGIYWEYIPYTPRELRERAYETEKVITFEDELMTVDEANRRWQEYQAENNAKSAELTELIAAAKAAVRERYPDETAEYAESSENTVESAGTEATEKAE